MATTPQRRKAAPKKKVAARKPRARKPKKLNEEDLAEFLNRSSIVRDAQEQAIRASRNCEMLQAAFRDYAKTLRRKYRLGPGKFTVTQEGEIVMREEN